MFSITDSLSPGSSKNSDLPVSSTLNINLYDITPMDYFSRTQASFSKSKTFRDELWRRRHRNHTASSNEKANKFDIEAIFTRKMDMGKLIENQMAEVMKILAAPSVFFNGNYDVPLPDAWLPDPDVTVGRNKHSSSSSSSVSTSIYNSSETEATRRRRHSLPLDGGGAGDPSSPSSDNGRFLFGAEEKKKERTYRRNSDVALTAMASTSVAPIANQFDTQLIGSKSDDKISSNGSKVVDDDGTTDTLEYVSEFFSSLE